MKRLALLLLLLAAPARARAGVETWRVGGRERWALVREPEAGRAPRPLVLLLHGGGGDPAGAEELYGMTELARREGFLLAYPAGTGRFRKRFLTWNAGNCCGYAKKHEVDDVAFLEALVARLVKEGRADPGRVYLTGMSNGAKMSHRFACERAGLVAAIAPVAGALAARDCRPSRPVSVLAVHGLADEHVPFKGGTGRKTAEKRVDRPIEEGLRVWREADGCPAKSRVVETGSFRDERWTGCREGSEVGLVTHPGEHIWPGGKQGRYRGADPVLPEPRATPLIWDFFQAHPRP